MAKPIIRTKGGRPLPVPERGGSIDELRPFLNIQERDFVLVAGLGVELYNPEGPYPIAFITGPPDAAKTTLGRIIRNMADPHQADFRKIGTPIELILAAANNHCLGLENVSYLTGDMADALCTVSTGVGFGKRKLYTDGDEFLVQVGCPVIINGIPSDLAKRGDLADRAVVMRLPSLPANKHIPARVFKARFEQAWPRLLGVFLDGVVGALRDYDKVELGRMPRMVDFVSWSEAGCRAMGFKAGEFEKAYARSQAWSLQIAAEDDIVVVGVAKMMQGRAEWRGKPTELLVELRRVLQCCLGSWLRSCPVQCGSVGSIWIEPRVCC